LVCFNEQRLTVGHPATLLARTAVGYGSISGRVYGCFHPTKSPVAAAGEQQTIAMNSALILGRMLYRTGL
jgi:hypothetical protein